MIDISPAKNIRKFAAIDVGTNTVRLLVVQVNSDSSVTVLQQAQEITRLGEGMGRQLKDGPIARTVAVIEDFVQRARRLQATPIAILATSAARRAENGVQFCKQVHKVTGILPEIVSGTREAELTVHGVLSAVPHARANAVILDIGGGSTEIVLVAEEKTVNIRSLEIGAVSLTEKFFPPHHPITGTDLAGFREYAKQALNNLTYPSDITWLGTAGTITTLAAMDQQMLQYDSKRINGYLLFKEKVSQWLGRLLSMPLKERRKLAGLEPGRADIIVAGTGLLEIIMEQFGLDSLIVSDAGFREGIIYTSLREDK